MITKMIVPIRNTFDGNYKLFTKDCNECEYYRKIKDKELCGWGVAFKYLARTEKPRKCEVKNREPVQNPSIKYLDKIINQIK